MTSQRIGPPRAEALTLKEAMSSAFMGLIAAKAEAPARFSTSLPAHSYVAEMEVTLGIWVNGGLPGFLSSDDA
jgi:hypothetical protein